MKKLDWDSIKSIAGKFCTVAGYGLLVLASRKVADYTVDDCVSAFAGYDDAIGAIMKSGMYSGDIRDAVAALKRNEDHEYYRAIIHVAKDSRLYSHDKVDLIKGLSEN